jgi:hypothetical protein
VVKRVPRDSEPYPIDVFVQSERLLRGSSRFREDEETFKDEAREFVVNVLECEPFDCDVAVYLGTRGGTSVVPTERTWQNLRAA